MHAAWRSFPAPSLETLWMYRYVSAHPDTGDLVMAGRLSLQSYDDVCLIPTLFPYIVDILTDFSSMFSLYLSQFIIYLSFLCFIIPPVNKLTILKNNLKPLVIFQVKHCAIICIVRHSADNQRRAVHRYTGSGKMPDCLVSALIVFMLASPIFW